MIRAFNNDIGAWSVSGVEGLPASDTLTISTTFPEPRRSKVEGGKRVPGLGAARAKARSWQTVQEAAEGSLGLRWGGEGYLLRGPGGLAAATQSLESFRCSAKGAGL